MVKVSTVDVLFQKAIIIEKKKKDDQSKVGKFSVKNITMFESSTDSKENYKLVIEDFQNRFL